MKIAAKNPYTSDNIGNLERSETLSHDGGVTNTYTANSLNQYTEVATTVTNVPIHDLDGNMTEYDGWTYTWNGENRMVSATNSEHVISWNYDYMGRCFEKIKDGVTNSFVWDGYNIIQEFQVSGFSSQICHNVWGLDASQTLSGAGGVGGLLSVNCSSGSVSCTYFPCFDGNGNICQYVDENGSVVTSREYSPFGITITYETTLPASGGFTHWWSTKPWDADAGMSEYEFRMYLPAIGRWMSPDPIGERGGLNLYGFVGNNGVLLFDAQGKTFYVNPHPRWYYPGGGLTEEAGPAAIGMRVEADETCGQEGGGCYRLSFERIEMLVHYWYQRWPSSIQEHELLHVADLKEIAYDQAEEYARSKEGCYETQEEAECWKNLMPQAARTYLAKAKWITIVRRHSPLDAEEQAESEGDRDIYQLHLDGLRLMEQNCLNM